MSSKKGTLVLGAMLKDTMAQLLAEKGHAHLDVRTVSDLAEVGTEAMVCSLQDPEQLNHALEGVPSDKLALILMVIARRLLSRFECNPAGFERMARFYVGHATENIAAIVSKIACGQ